MSTVIETLNQEITGASSDWPLLAYDDQVTTGTIILFDAANPACWPGGVISTVHYGDVFQNLAEDMADATVEAAGTLPAYDTNGLLFSAGAANLLFPAGFGDMAALGWPNMHMSTWFRVPAVPVVAASKCPFGYGQVNTTLQYGVIVSYSANGTQVGVTPRYAGAAGTQILLAANSQVCASVTAVDAGGGARRVRTYVNNVQVVDVTITPAIPAVPTQQARIGKGSTSYAQHDGRIQRVLVENCTVAGRDPEAARAAEWAAKHAFYGL
jgi:hypothetical protein